ncbi:multidrug resistance-associated protein 1-like [Argopecten irradians]|uniref:multidrug resistance-associated protein 1-like n=1 Tax=Argopecten irradians TaxID=31199 RepID=UPI003717C58D
MSIVLPVLDSSMDERGGGFCNSPFLDEQQTWNTTDPDFSACFQKTVILWIPCAFLVLVTPFHIYFLTKSQSPTIPFSWLNILKMVLSLTVAVAAIADIGKSLQQFATEEPVATVDFISPLILCLTMALATFLIQHERKHGLQSSGVMFLFWMMLLIAEILIFQSKVRTAVREGIDDMYRFVIFFIEFPLILVQFILTWFVDRRKNEFVPTAVVHDKPCPESDSSFISRISFWWFSSTVVQGYKRALDRSDLFAMNEEDMCSSVIPHFDKYWQQEIEKEKSSKRHAETPSTDGIELQTRNQNGETYTEVHVADGKPPYKAKLLICLIKAFWPMFLLSGLFKLIYDILQFVSPLILRLLIQFTRDKTEYQWRGYLYAVLMFVVAVVQSFILHQYFHIAQLLGMKLRTSIITIVYRKMLLLSNAARRTSTVGEIVNLMSVDAQRFMDLMTYFHTIWSGPFQIAVSLYFLWQTLGPSVLAGTGVMIIMIPVNAVIAKKSRDLQMKQMRLKDTRIKLMNEVLNGIKVLKLYAWEKSFEKQVLNIRNKELQVLKRMAYLNAAVSFTWTTAPFLVSLVTFAVYVLVDSNNILDAEKAFVSLSLFNILRFPLSMLPQVISNIVQVSVSLKRLQHFLDNEQLNIFSIEKDASAKHAIAIEKGTFTWENEAETPTLREINLEIPDGSLVAVVGTVGSGKSSILSAILGEMEKLKGKANVKGSIAYVAQQAWIQNATLQNNILFGKTKYQTEYNNVLEACALKTDLEILPAGDMTEIGEKGINLSGGQKQRVSLARAVYQDADIYLLDDPLSAVDSHVGKHIFDEVIGPNGLLREKTRVLVTHGIGFLPKVDLIVVLVNGQISEVGSFQELIGHPGAFAEFLKNYLTEELDNEDVDLDLEEIEGGIVKMSVFLSYLRSVGPILSCIIILFYILYNITSVYSNIWLSEWSNDEATSVNGTIDTAQRDLRLGVYGALGVIQGLVVVAGSVGLYIGNVICGRIFHAMILANMLASPIQFFDTTPLGRIMNRFSKDIDTIDTMIPRICESWLHCLLRVVSVPLIIAYSTPLFLTVLLPLGIFYFIVQRFYVSTSRQLKRLESVSRSPIYSHFGETVTGVTTIRAYRQQDRFITESESKVDENNICYFPSIVANRWLAIRLEFVANCIVFFAALFAVIGRNDLSAGLVGLSITYALNVTQTLNWLVRMTCELETNIVAVERVKEYSETPTEAAWEIEDKKPDPRWPDTGKVTFDNYGTRYREGLDLVLKGISCDVQPGEKVGIVGRTGAGKSSLTLALFRIIEKAQGSIIIDGTDISSLGLHDLRSKITIIPQEPVLFSGTLKMNLDPFEQYSDADLWRALEHAHLKNFVKELPTGLMHECSEGGENLSVGQRQLVCLARALLRKTKILVLDEATAAVDLETDDLIQNTIRTEFHDCTILTIAHRLNTIMDYDKIMVLDAGEIREYEAPHTLLQDKDTIFYGMAKDAGLVF